MTRVRPGLAGIAAAAAALAFISPGAQAGTIEIGSSLGGVWPLFSSCPVTCTLTQSALPGATLTSPVDGAIVGWTLRASSAGEYRLRVLNRKGGTEFGATGTSAPVTVPIIGSGVPVFFPTLLPIKAGQAIGIDLDGKGGISIREGVGGAQNALFIPPIADGSSASPLATGNGVELGFNATIQPAPSIVDFTPSSGPLGGENIVTITGTEFGFESVTGVSFGGTPAPAFTYDSEKQISVVVPAASQPGDVPITVTTTAGTATSSIPYRYEAPTSSTESCVVPKLRGKKLKTVKRGLKRFHCALGKVRKRKGATARKGKVVRQRPKPGSIRPAGTKVMVTLG